jgi:hypothetical protein
LTDFVALYRGRTVSEAELVAVSAERRLVKRFFADLLGDSQSAPKVEDAECRVPIFEVVRDE